MLSRILIKLHHLVKLKLEKIIEKNETGKNAIFRKAGENKNFCGS
jgi:hypothetical protein